MKKKIKKIDKYGRPLYDKCRDCGKKYKLDWSLEDETGDDQLRPVRNYCVKCRSEGNSHYYPFI